MSVSNNSNLTYHRYNDHPNLTSQFRTILPSEVSYSTVQPIPITNINPTIPIRINQEPLTQTFHQPPKTTVNSMPPERYVRIIHEQPQPIVQHKIIQEQTTTQPKVQGLKRDSLVQRPIDDDPMVQTVRGSDMNYYSNYQSRPKPPKESFQEKSRKSFCAPWLLGLLGFLALAGLITALVLAAQTHQDNSTNSDLSKAGIAPETIIQRENPKQNDKTVSTSSLPPQYDYSITVQKKILNKTKLQQQNSITSTQHTNPPTTEVKQGATVDSNAESSINSEPKIQKPLTVEPIMVPNHELAQNEGLDEWHHHLQLNKIIK